VVLLTQLQLGLVVALVVVVEETLKEVLVQADKVTLAVEVALIFNLGQLAVVAVVLVLLGLSVCLMTTVEREALVFLLALLVLLLIVLAVAVAVLQGL
jgi:hypothetical protein